jgi:hypothetical protein
LAIKSSGKARADLKRFGPSAIFFLKGAENKKKSNEKSNEKGRKCFLGIGVVLKKLMIRRGG